MKTELLTRLREILEDEDLGNATPLADAAADAIIIDARLAGATEEKVRALKDVHLRDAAEQLHRHLNGLRRPERPLPFGNMIEGIIGISIGTHTLLPDAGRPGLHPAETLRDDAHGPNFTRLVAMIKEKIGGHPWEAIGLPTPSFSVLIDSRHHLDFPPFEEAGGVVLRQQVSYNYANIFCSLMLKDLESLANEIVSGMEDLWDERYAIGQHVSAVRRAFEKRVIEVHGPMSPVTLRLIALDWHEQVGEDSENPYLHVEFNSLNYALRPGVMGIPLHGDTELDDSELELADSWESLSSLKADFASMGAIGEIDELAAAIAHAAPEGERAVLDYLSKALETHVTLPGLSHDIHTKLFWSNGCILAHIHRSPSIRSTFDRLEVRGKLPATVLTGSVGRPLNALVELPFKFNGKIEAIEELEDGWLSFKLLTARLLIDEYTGTIRRKAVE